MDVPFVIRRRLEQLGLDQRDLARAAQVTESYVSQLLSRKKAPPAPGRTDIYDKMDRFLKLPRGELAKLATLQRKEQLKRELGDEPQPLYGAVRQSILRKCNPQTARHVRAVFEKQPFGELERLVTQKLLQVVKDVARQELDNEQWIRAVARAAGRTYEETRVSVLEFLDTGVLDLSTENCVSFLEPLVESWDVDLETFALEIVLNPRMVPRHVRRFAFGEQDADLPSGDEPGLAQFLEDSSMSADVTPEEVSFLRALRFGAKRPTALYYYRELQSLRDPLHFRPA